MEHDDVTLWTAREQAAAVATGRITSRELLEAFLARIDAVNPSVNAVVTIDADGARHAADAADAAVEEGAPLGPLHGLPITVKDALETAGMRSTGGAVELTDNVPDRDAPAVAAVKAAGAIVVGKTNLPRWSGDIQAFNEIFGTTNNPWDLARVPGGSSGGAAVAVATGMTSFEIGTDIGGSIRFPAAYNGVFGHKPSFGVVPSTGYLDHVEGGTTEADVNVIGPIARSAGDLDLLLSIMARNRPPWVAALGDRPADPRRLRVAAWLDDAFCPVDAAVVTVLERAVTALEADGVQVDRGARPDLDPKRASDLGLALVAAATQRPGSDGGPLHRIWCDWHIEREAIRARWAAFFADHDVLLLPVGFVAPFAHQQEGTFADRTLTCNDVSRPYADIVAWTILTGMAYLPSTVPPIGTTDDGLPVGIQVVGAYGADRTTIAFADHLAAVAGGYVPPPLLDT